MMSEMSRDDKTASLGLQTGTRNTQEIHETSARNPQKYTTNKDTKDTKSYRHASWYYDYARAP